MDIQTLTDFFMWCTIINGLLFILSATMIMFAPDFVYRTQSKWFPISRDSFNTVIYGFMGLFKIFLIMFNMVPYAALVIIG